MRVLDLRPGDVYSTDHPVLGPVTTCVVIANIDRHPHYPNLHLVIWWIGGSKGEELSFDALSPFQELYHGTYEGRDVAKLIDILQTAWKLEQ